MHPIVAQRTCYAVQPQQRGIVAPENQRQRPAQGKIRLTIKAVQLARCRGYGVGHLPAIRAGVGLRAASRNENLDGRLRRSHALTFGALRGDLPRGCL